MPFSRLQFCSSTDTYFLGRVYRFHYNGMESDPEVSGSGNSYTTQFRQYDPRLGRWKSLDPLAGKYPSQSPFNAFNNNPIYFVDPLGLEGTNAGEKKQRKEKSSKKAKSEETPSQVDQNVTINTEDQKYWNDGSGYYVVTPAAIEHNKQTNFSKRKKSKAFTENMVMIDQQTTTDFSEQHNYYHNHLKKPARWYDVHSPNNEANEERKAEILDGGTMSSEYTVEIENLQPGDQIMIFFETDQGTVTQVEDYTASNNNENYTKTFVVKEEGKTFTELSAEDNNVVSIRITVWRANPGDQNSLIHIKTTSECVTTCQTGVTKLKTRK